MTDIDSIDPAFGHYLAGLTDGEGCFSISDGGKRGQLRCVFRIALRRDDGAVLREIHRTLGVGQLRWSVKEHPEHNDQASWTVSSKPGCRALVAFFDRFPLRAKKARDFAVWKRGVEMWGNYYKGQRYADWTPMEQLRDELVRVREYESRPTLALPVEPPRDAVKDRDKRIAALWLEGLGVGPISEAIGISKDNVHRRIWVLREQGVDLPYRRGAMPREDAIREARAQVREQREAM